VSDSAAPRPIPGPGATLRGPELRWVTADLETIRDRLAEVADKLETTNDGPCAAHAGWALAVAQRRLWALAGELVGVQKRLLTMGADLIQSARATRAVADTKELDAAAELLAVIQCVIADNLDPAVGALVGICRERMVEAAGRTDLDDGIEGEPATAEES